MNNRLQRLIAPGTRLFLLLMAVFAVVTFFFFSEPLGIAEGAVVLLLGVYALVDSRRRKKELLEYIESVTYDAESAKNNTLMNFPLPIVVFRMSDYKVVWGNQIFFGLFGGQRPVMDAFISQMVPGFTAKWLTEGKTQYPGLVQVGERKYQLHGNIVRNRASAGEENAENVSAAGVHGFMGITYWVDVTEYDAVKLEYEDSRPVTMILAVDNYDELMKNLPDRAKADLRALIEDVVSQWCEGRDGFFIRVDRDRFMFLCETRYLAEITERKFDVLEKVRGVTNPSGIHATLSIGVGRDGNGFEENYSFANLSLEMALSRGGDQAVIKNRYNFEFFGGRGTEVATRSKVKTRVTATALAELIRASGQVFIMGHKLSDMDCIGSAAGMACVCRKLDIAARIVVDPSKNAAGKLIDMLQGVPEYEETFITPEDAILHADSRTLLLVVDTNRPEQVESLSLLESCTRVALIDHHRRAASYIQNAALAYHEPFASSACELVSELIQELTEPKDVIKAEAEALLAGMVLDTKNFTIRTTDRTFDAAAFLRRIGADTVEVKRLLQNDMEHTVEKYAILQSAKIYRGSVAIAVSETTRDRVVAAQAADELLNVEGIGASFVLCAMPESGVVVSARSIGDVNVQLVVEKFGGGGNRASAGAQLPDMTLREAVNTLCASIDSYFDEETEQEKEKEKKR